MRVTQQGQVTIPVERIALIQRVTTAYRRRALNLQDRAWLAAEHPADAVVRVEAAVGEPATVVVDKQRVRTSRLGGRVVARAERSTRIDLQLTDRANGALGLGRTCRPSAAERVSGRGSRRRASNANVSCISSASVSPSTCTGANHRAGLVVAFRGTN